jgi:hydroxyquinol 1,2-dioxygenase
VLSDDGESIAGARVEIWQADEQGMYDVQYADLDAPRGRGHLFTDPDGQFSFWSVKPVAYPIPDDGPVGDLLKAAGRGPMRPAHVHFMVSAQGWRTLTTHVFLAGDRYLNFDAVFGVRSSLVCEIKAQAPGSAPDGRLREEPYWLASYDLILHPAEES